MPKAEDSKYKKLFLGLLFDVIGMLSFAIPLIGDFTDIIWAPLAAWLMTRMYKGRAGQVAGVLTFLEELCLGFIDFIPSFTIMWLYTYVIKGSKQENTIEIK